MRKRITILFTGGLCTLMLCSCLQSSSAIRLAEDGEAGIPEISYPADNAYTRERWLLGKLLFYDKALSVDNSISCASCHMPGLAFSDSVAMSRGSYGRAGTRNAPSLANVALHPYYTRDGGVPTLEMQVLVPVQEHNEFDFNILEIATRLQKNPKYRQLSKKAYNRELDYYVITRSLANFERSLISADSRYDRFIRGRNKRLFSESEKKGMELFFSKRTNCAECHSGFNFSNYSFQNTGLYEHYNDIGRKRLTLEEKDLELFKVPSLRNIALTAPYMHDGSMLTLEQVVEHYNSGGRENPRKSDLVRPLGLNNEEKAQLVAFLKTLSDEQFVRNKKWKLN